MVFSVTWDATFEANPEDSDLISQGAERMRELRVAIRERMEAAGLDWDTLGMPDIADAAFAATTKMLFAQTAAPSFWTKDTDQDDRVIMVSSGTPTTGGSWTINGVTVDGHTLITNEIPAHTHEVGTRIDSRTTGGELTLLGSSFTGFANTSSVGGGAAHNHGLTADGTWRPAFLEVIKATKN